MIERGNRVVPSGFGGAPGVVGVDGVLGERVRAEFEYQVVMLARGQVQNGVQRVAAARANGPAEKLACNQARILARGVLRCQSHARENTRFPA